MGQGCKCLRPKPLEPPEPESLKTKYEVDTLGVLGQGTFATVFKAKERATRKDVAVKMIDKATSRRDLLNTEIWILQNFGNHANIVNVYDMYETETEVQLVIELMLGGELFDLLDENGPYGEAFAAKYLKALASGLSYLHGGRVAHRDLKPENLLLTSKGPEGILKISDFGLAKIMGDEDSMKVACGTWIYCAPEVLLLKHNKVGEYGLKCDVFSVGCILFIMMGGYHPFDFDGEDDEELMQECIVSDTWDFEDPAWSTVSFQAKDLIENMLKWEPDERLSSQELLDHPWTQGKHERKAASKTPDQMKITLEIENVQVSVDSRTSNDALPEAVQADGTGGAPEATAVVPRPPTIHVVAPPNAEGTGGAPEQAVEPGYYEVDAGTGGGVLDPSLAHAQRNVSRRPMSAMSATVRGKAKLQEARRTSLHSINTATRNKHMPKKHVPHAGSHAEDVGQLAPIGSIELKGVGINFNAKANETRWEKYYMKTLETKCEGAGEQQDQPAAISQDEPLLSSAGASAQGAKKPSSASAAATADALANSSRAGLAAGQSAGASSPRRPDDVIDASTPVKKTSAKTKPGTSAKGKARQSQAHKLTVPGTTPAPAKFQTVEEWKAKQAPKLVRDSMSDPASGAERRTSLPKNTATVKHKAQGKKKATVRKAAPQEPDIEAKGGKGDGANQSLA